MKYLILVFALALASCGDSNPFGDVTQICPGNSGDRCASPGDTTNNGDSDVFKYDPDGFDVDGYDRDGYDRDGYDEDGFDRNGLDINGLDKDGNAPVDKG